MRRSGQDSLFREVRQASHYPEIDRPVIVMAKHFDAGTRTGPHAHKRAQILFAISGLLVANTHAGQWVVPADHALWIPAGLIHDVSMHGPVAMRTAYVRETEALSLHRSCRVLRVGGLLEATLIALAEDIETYDESGRGGHLAWIILDEVRRSAAAPFELPIPTDHRLERLAHALIQKPGCPATLDEWAEEIGLSRRTLTRLFRSQTGMSFGVWRRRLRLLTGAVRLADGEPIARVAASLGYQSVAAFRAMTHREAASSESMRLILGEMRSGFGGYYGTWRPHS